MQHIKEKYNTKYNTKKRQQKSPGCYAGAFFMFYSAFCNNVKDCRGVFLDLYLRFQFTG